MMENAAVNDQAVQEETPRKAYGKTYRAPAAIPFLTVVEDADGQEWERYGEGWFRVPLDHEADPVGTTDLKFPVRVVIAREGEKKPEGSRRPEKRKKKRDFAKARVRTVKRQLAAAEAANEGWWKKDGAEGAPAGGDES